MTNAANLGATCGVVGGKYGVLLGTKLYGLAMRTVGFFLPLALPRFRVRPAGVAA